MAPSLPGRGEVNFLQKKAFCKRDLSGKFSFRDQEPRRLKDDDAEDDESHGEYAGMQPFFSWDQFSGVWKIFFDLIKFNQKHKQCMNFGSISNLNLILGSDGGNELDEWLPLEL